MHWLYSVERHCRFFETQCTWQTYSNVSDTSAPGDRSMVYYIRVCLNSAGSHSFCSIWCRSVVDVLYYKLYDKFTVSWTSGVSSIGLGLSVGNSTCVYNETVIYSPNHPCNYNSHIFLSHIFGRRIMLALGFTHQVTHQVEVSPGSPA